MADIVSPEKRSQNMSSIKSKNTKPEIFVRKQLFARGYRYRIASSSVPGHPDIYLAKHNLAVFIHGCFWHRHKNCKLAYQPKSNMAFWQKKFEANQSRDRIVKEQLEQKGIRCLIVWECAIRESQKKNVDSAALIDSIEIIINSSELYSEISAKSS